MTRESQLEKDVTKAQPRQRSLVRLRRISPVAMHSGDRLLSERIAGNKTWAVGSGAGLAEAPPGRRAGKLLPCKGRRSDPDLAMKDFTPYRATTMFACFRQSRAEEA